MQTPRQQPKFNSQLPLFGDLFRESLAPETLALISGHELLIQHLGHWPTFHDFEVLSLTLDRAVVPATTSDLRTVFMVFDSSKRPNDPQRRQGSAEFLFSDIGDLEITGFNRQNPTLGVSIAPYDSSCGTRRLRVNWGGSALKHQVSFNCANVSVLRVVDLNPYRTSPVAI